jgi:phage gpG-like protein
VGVRGDGLKGLEDIRRRMASIAKPEFRRQLSANLGAEALTQTHEGFRLEEAPDGTPWKPSTSPNTLRDSSRLMNSVNAQAFTRGFVLATNAKYAAIHQYGGVIKAKKGKALAFRVKTGSAIAYGRPLALDIATGRRAVPGKDRRYAKPRTLHSDMIFVKKVTIPARPHIPEGQLSPRWVRALDAAASTTMLAQMGNDF